MSKVIWRQALIPPPEVDVIDRNYDLYDCGFSVTQTRTFPQTEEELVELPDPRAYRAMSRAAVLISAVGLRARDIVAPYISKDPYSVGIYCAAENGATDYNSVKQMVNTPPEHFASTYKRLRNAKQYLQQLPNVGPAQLGIFLNVRGPINVYNHSVFSCLHALEQAEADLQQGVIKAALVCSAFSLDDALTSMRTRRQYDRNLVLSEGAGCLILVPNGTVTNWRSMVTEDSMQVYGIATKIVSLATEGANFHAH